MYFCVAIEFFWSLQTLKLNKIPSEIANMIVFSSKNTSWPKGLDMSRKKSLIFKHLRQT